MVTDELYKVIDQYNKLSQKKKDFQKHVEASMFEVEFCTKKLEEVMKQINCIKKSPSYNFVRSNGTMHYRRNSPSNNANRSN